MTDTIHRFDESLEKTRALDEDWWRDVYSSAFPDQLIGISEVHGDCQAQRSGIDRVLLLHGGKTVLVDEKTRLAEWPDILLEVWSDTAKKKRGWICKQDMHCDYVAYAFAATNTCYLLPYRNLREAWRRCHREWWNMAKSTDANGYRVIRAPNPSYTTTSVAVPIDVVLMAIADTMCVKVDR